MEYIIDETIAYTRQRKAFGKPILDNQVVHFRLAELQTEIELPALACLSGRRGAGGGPRRDQARVAWPSSRRVVCRGSSTDGCLQYWGGMGFTNETPVTRFYRDGRLTSIGGGADEVMLSILCKMMGTLPGSKA
jgi:citronellyl-CoA dehydrogenase